MHGIHKDQSTDLVRHRRDLFHRIDGADRIGRVTNGNDLRARIQFRAEVVQIKSAVFRTELYGVYFRSTLLEGAPWRNVGIVVQERGDNLITFPQLATQGPADREGERGHILAEDDFVRITAEHVGHGCVRRGEHLVRAMAGEELPVGIRVGMHQVVQKSHRSRAAVPGFRRERRNRQPVAR